MCPIELLNYTTKAINNAIGCILVDCGHNISTQNILTKNEQTGENAECIDQSHCHGDGLNSEKQMVIYLFIIYF